VKEGESRGSKYKPTHNDWGTRKGHKRDAEVAREGRSPSPKSVQVLTGELGRDDEERKKKGEKEKEEREKRSLDSESLCGGTCGRRGKTSATCVQRAACRGRNGGSEVCEERENGTHCIVYGGNELVKKKFYSKGGG